MHKRGRKEQTELGLDQQSNHPPVNPKLLVISIFSGRLVLSQTSRVPLVLNACKIYRSVIELP